MTTRSILLFEPDFPCWDEETFALAGEDPASLAQMLKEGCLIQAAGGYVLTEKGENERRREAEANWLSYAPTPSFDAERALWNNRLYLLMERAFLGRFGIKEYSLDEALPVIPALPDEQMMQISEGKMRYIWGEQPIIQNFLAEFPHRGVGSRGLTPPGEEAFAKWAAKNGAAQTTLCPNLILRSRYDFDLYRKAAPYPSDKYKMKDADRLFFFRVKSGGTTDFLRALGDLQLFLLAQKHIYIPGYGDIDSQDQENWTMAVIVCENEAELEKSAAQIAAYGKALIDPMPPLFLIGTSIERLRAQKQPEDTVYDWFCDQTTHIARPDI